MHLHISCISTLANNRMQGVRELNSTALWASADLRAYRTSKHNFYLLNFWRSFPSEDPAVTPHLKQSVRGQSIMWRSLRPELVRSNVVPLSPDANLLVTHDSPDWRQQADDVHEATRRLIHEVNNTVEVTGKVQSIIPEPVSTRGLLRGAKLVTLCLSLCR